MPPADWPVPAWLAAPALRLAIPDSPFGRGSPGGPLPSPIEEPVPSVELVPAGDVTEPAPDQEPDLAIPTAVPELPESLAATLARGVAAEATGHNAAEPLVVEPAAPPPLPLSAGEVRPTTRELRAEHPPAASPAPPRSETVGAAVSAGNGAVPSGLPTADLPPVMVEPLDSGGELAAPTEAAPVDNRPTMRNRRLYRRVGFEAALEIDGTAAKLLDLSMGGFAAANGPDVERRSVVPVSLRWSIDGVDISTRMRARMIHGNGARSGGRFVDLTASQTAFLRYVVTWRNQAVGALGTTTLLDAITRTPARPRQNDFLPPPEPNRPKTPWWSRWFGRFLPSRSSAAE